MAKVKIKLGDFVEDTLTSLTGTVIGKTEYLYGCVRIGVQPYGLNKDGNPFDMVWADEPQLTAIKKPNRIAVKATGGPREAPQGRENPS